MQQLAQRAFVTYLKSIYLKKDKEVFDASKLPIEDFAASLGLSATPKLRFLKHKLGGNLAPTEATHGGKGPHDDKSIFDNRKLQVNAQLDDVEDKILIPKESSSFDLECGKTEYVLYFFLHVFPDCEDSLLFSFLLLRSFFQLAHCRFGTRVSKKKKLKINLHRPFGTRVKFDDDGIVIPPLAALADTQTVDSSVHLDAGQFLYNLLQTLCLFC